MEMGYVIGLEALDRTHVPIAGGKAANLGELRRIEGVRVPDGFCVTTAAFDRLVAGTPEIEELQARLAAVAASDRDAIRTLSARARRVVEGVDLPEEVDAEIRAAVARRGEHAAWAVRSSATAEDGPTASFAGQHDTSLDVRGADAVVAHVRRCWASLFTERAVTYRARQHVDHRHVGLAVVVQRMVEAEVAGVMFTADPVTSNRRIAVVEAVLGHGEALVSGTADADAYDVRDGRVVHRRAAPYDPPALTDAQVLRLVELGRRIEGHFGCPQDIEWCLADGRVHVVQARPITTLFPVPQTDDEATHVYVSVGHQQMMTDAMRPLGLSVWQLTTPRPMSEAGGRLFVDVTRMLASPATRAGLIDALGTSDPLIGSALQAVVDRPGLLPDPPPGGGPARPPAGGPAAPIEPDPAIVTELMARTEASVAALARDIAGRSGTDLLAFIRTDLQDGLVPVLFDPRGLAVISAAQDASRQLADRLQAWLGEGEAVDALTQSVERNVTSEMGLALLDVADALRPHPEVVALLQDADDDGVLDALPALDGGAGAREAIQGFLDRYGMRCVGEIDITRPRWSERPTTLLPMLLANVRAFGPGEAARRLEQGRAAAADKEREVLERLRALPQGEAKAAEAAALIDRVRTFSGYREHPKYGMVCRYWIYKQALLAEAERLVAAGVLAEVEDVLFLRFEELEEVVRTHAVDRGLLRERREAFRSHQALRPPRVLTSDGEVITGTYGQEDLPEGALRGLAVSAGTVEGRARVVLDPAEADLQPGDILVTPYTDPSWTPVFLSVAGLVTEVGGHMTHGAVIAREYGLPAVVGVEDATRRIEDGRRIRLHGSRGHVELL